MRRQPCWILSLAVLALLGGMLAFSAAPPPSRAADDLPPEEGELKEENPGPYDAWHLPIGEPAFSPAAPAPAGTRDQFGYQVDGAVAFNWVDASSGNKVAFVDPDDGFSDPIDIGFDFKFYENTYNQVSISPNGFISFEQEGETFTNYSIPLDTPPNNLIAVFWDDLSVQNGQVYVKLRNINGAKSLVIEWHQVHRFGAGEKISFEAILYESGDILMQYQEMNGVLNSASVGIEDADGADGLLYLYNEAGMASNKAIKFTRPGPAPRVKAFPAYQSGFVYQRRGTFEVEIRNMNDEGSDTIDLQATSSASGWKVDFYKADGKTPLPDSDGDGLADTGLLSHGASKTVALAIRAPSSARVGNSTVIELQAISSDDPGVSAQASIQAAIPASFAQAYSDSQTGIHIHLTWDQRASASQLTDFFTGNTLSLAARPGGGFTYTWEENGIKTGQNGIATFSDIKYAWLDRFGLRTLPLGTLTDSATRATPQLLVSARYPAAATAPDGNVGLIWAEYQEDLANARSNSNIFFAVLDSAGQAIFGPVNVTGNQDWRGEDDLTVPVFTSPRITATEDKRFILAWIEGRHSSGGEMNSVNYAVYGSQGSPVKDPTLLAESEAGSTLIIDPAVARMTGARTLVAYSLFDRQGSTYSIVYAILSSLGERLREPASLPGSSGWRVDAEQVANGNNLLAWTDPQTGKITYAVLDAPGNALIAGPSSLPLIGIRKPDYVSVTADPSGRAVLTWMDAEWKDYLYYALVDGSGALLTPAMIFLTGQALDPMVQTSIAGQGNAPYDGAWRTFLPGVNR